MNVGAVCGIATQVTTNVWGQTTTSACTGSGFVLTEDGYIVTNNHVVADASEGSIVVQLYSGEEYPAAIVGTDSMNDVALLKIEAEGLQTVTIGDSDQIEVGETVEAIGNPALDVADLDAVSAIAKRHGLPLVVDATFATPYLLRPFEHGADIVVHSLTKWLGGHGTALGGIVVDGDGELYTKAAAQALALAVSLAGGLLSTLALWLLLRAPRRMSYIGVSLIAAVCHNVGQLAAAAALSGTPALFHYGKYLLLLAALTGFVTGVILNIVMPRIAAVFDLYFRGKDAHP